jgi:hypothetical protein
MTIGSLTAIVDVKWIVTVVETGKVREVEKSKTSWRKWRIVAATGKATLAHGTRRLMIPYEQKMVRSGHDGDLDWVSVDSCDH